MLWLRIRSEDIGSRLRELEHAGWGETVGWRRRYRPRKVEGLERVVRGVRDLKEQKGTVKEGYLELQNFMELWNLEFEEMNGLERSHMICG